MKFLLSITVLLSLTNLTKAQKPAEDILPIDEQGKLIYYEVVNSKVPKDSLALRAINYLKTNKELKYKAVKDDTALIATGKLVINKTLLVMSHPSGEVSYQFEVNIRNGKYRFWLTDFKFFPYQRDRYGNFVLSTTVGIPLENNPGKLNASEWKEYNTQTAKHAKEFAIKFKNSMADKTQAVAIVPAKTVVKKDWK